MLFTKETDYAIRFFRELADGKQHSVGEITDRQLIPKQFAYKILRKLSKAEMVKVTRGTKGGCTLNTDLKKTSLYDIMEVIEEKNCLVACMEKALSSKFNIILIIISSSPNILISGRISN